MPGDEPAPQDERNGLDEPAEGQLEEHVLAGRADHQDDRR
jgi:hypothetical protein